MDYTSHSDADIQHMLEVIGVNSIAELIAESVPDEMRMKSPLDLPDGESESALFRKFSAWAGENESIQSKLNFMGGGSYDHYSPAAISSIISRSEYATAYTPYQAEVAQGTLQTIYEFQTLIARLMSMDAANASHYDGATALAEAVLMAVRKSRKAKTIIPAGLNPNYKEVLKTYCHNINVEIIELSNSSGMIELSELKTHIDGVGVLVLQQPNFFGLLEPAEQAASLAHEAGVIVVSSSNPVSLGLLKPPGDWGADIATAEGQSLGVPMSYGGPYLGIFAVKKPFLRQMPGRLVARANDKNGKDGFVLTLQTREQHIRREKATSNICTNQALVALSALVYLCLLGRNGLKRMALDSYRRAHYLSGELDRLPGCVVKYKGEFFNEFVIDLPRSAAEIQAELLKRDILAGPVLDRWYGGMENSLMIAVTEQRSREDLDRFVSALREIVGK